MSDEDLGAPQPPGRARGRPDGTTPPRSYRIAGRAHPAVRGRTRGGAGLGSLARRLRAAQP
jgi:hypothetical protein